MKNVVICSSIFLYREIEEWKEKLERDGYNVIKYPEIVNTNIELNKYEHIHIEHYKKIFESDILLVLNMERDDIQGYIGPSVFAEVAFAIGLNVTLGKQIQIYYVENLPKSLSYSEELRLWDELEWIRPWIWKQNM